MAAGVKKTRRKSTTATKAGGGKPNRRATKTPQRMTAHARAKFLNVLRETGNVSHAARSVGISRDAVYNLRERDETFGREWDSMLREAVDGLEFEAHRRAVQGVEEPVYQGGQQVGTIRRYSDTLLLSLLKAHAPDKYRERRSVEHSGPGGGPMQMDQVRRNVLALGEDDELDDALEVIARKAIERDEAQVGDAG